MAGHEAGSGAGSAGQSGAAGNAAISAGAGAGGEPGSSRITFEDLALEDESYWNGSDESGSFASGFGVFANQYDPEWDAWGGFAYSSTTDTETPDYSNQYSAAPGSGAGGSRTYAVAYRGLEGRPSISFPDAGDGIVLRGAYFTNTTYTASALRAGTPFSKIFGGSDGTDPDWYLVEVFGVMESGDTSGPLSIYLADFRSDDPSLDTIETAWRWVELGELGAVIGLEFELSSSDTGSLGLNTPAYFALDDLTRE